MIVPDVAQEDEDVETHGMLAFVCFFGDFLLHRYQNLNATQTLTRQDLLRLPDFWQIYQNDLDRMHYLPAWATSFFESFPWTSERLQAFLQAACWGEHASEPDVEQDAGAIVDLGIISDDEDLPPVACLERCSNNQTLSTASSSSRTHGLKQTKHTLKYFVDLFGNQRVRDIHACKAFAATWIF